MFLGGESSTLVGINFFWGTSTFDREVTSCEWKICGNPVDELWKSSETGKQLSEDMDTNITSKTSIVTSDIGDASRAWTAISCVWRSTCPTKSTPIWLQLVLSPFFFSMLLFLDFSLKDTLNKTITAISQNLLKQHIFFFRMAHSSFSLQCESREILSSAWKDIRYIKWVRWQWTKPWWCISLQKVNRRKNTGLFQIESRFCRELETTLCKSPAIGVHLFFFF